MAGSKNKSSLNGLSIAVIGSGISGLSCAWLLSKQHNVTLFEKDDRLGGHSHTVTIEGMHSPVPVDTGFIVFNLSINFEVQHPSSPEQEHF